MNNNIMFTSINTDRDIATILNQFSEDFIINSITESLRYKFRPFGDRMPNYPYIIDTQFQGIMNNYTGGDNEQIIEKKLEIYHTILNIICKIYNLQISQEIPDEQLYSLVYVLYQILISEFTERMLSFFSDYIVINKELLLNSIPEDQKIQTRSTYTKKVYSDPSTIAMYENMEKIIDIVAGLDIPFVKLMEYLSDINTAQFIGTYLVDVGDIYKNHFASYIRNQITRTDMITSIKIRFVNITQQNMNIRADVSNNPYIN